jgi:hypothetical protein
MRYKLILKPDGTWLHIFNFDDGSILRWIDGKGIWGNDPSQSGHIWNKGLCECLLEALLIADGQGMQLTA